MPDIFTAPKTKTKVTTNKIGTPGIFAALVHNPHGLTFANQEKDERITIFTRRHFATNFLWIALTFIALFIPMLFSILLHMVNLQLPAISISFTIILYLFYYLIVLGFSFYNYVDWFYNIGIVTQKRLIDIDFINLSYIDVAATTIRELEDASFIQKGFFASYFDYGDVIARTVAGKEETFVFEKVPHPEKIVDIISKILGE